MHAEAGMFFRRQQNIFVSMLLLVLSLSLASAHPLHADGEQHQHARKDVAVFNIPFRHQTIVATATQPGCGACRADVEVLIIALSRPETFKTRKAIRASWGANIPKGVQLLFLIGKPHTKASPSARHSWERPSAFGKDLTKIVAELRAEHEKYGDLLTTGNIDQYGANVTLKMLTAFHWFEQFCPSAKYLLKIDDDSVINVPRLQFWIKHKFESMSEKAPKHRAIFGTLHENKTPFRNPSSKYYLSTDEFPSDALPTYTNGPTYMLTRDAVRGILEHTKHALLIRMEDVFITGILAHEANVQLYDVTDHFRADWSVPRIHEHEKCYYPQNGGEPVPYITSLTLNDQSDDVEGIYRALMCVHCANKKPAHEKANYK